MQLLSYTVLALALAVNADKATYFTEKDASCVTHEDTGITNCQPGHLPNAAVVRIAFSKTLPKIRKQSMHTNMNIPNRSMAFPPKLSPGVSPAASAFHQVSRVAVLIVFGKVAGRHGVTRVLATAVTVNIIDTKPT